ncbi:MAG: type I glyceraldehyde-3-phosphate dehydrogenase [Candidatus Peribacteraceae bacterium]|nr:type I glyceraldehyde-3-phosphate dehydrogenase [Candidatus Peribacteraceae bacterium]
MKITINGFGRIGRQTLRAAIAKDSPLEIVAVNDLVPAETLAHLFEFDSVYGKFDGTVESSKDALKINGKEIKVCAEKDPAKLPWKDLGVDVVIESTGFFRDKQSASAHLDAGAKCVIISAPGKEVDGTFVRGVNCDSFDPKTQKIVSNASCTTNCLAPVAKVLAENFGIVKGLMTTTHAYTSDQRLIDAPHSDPRRARAAALSIIPTSTGAAQAVGEVLPDLKGKLTGISFRVPTPTVSVVDFVAELKKPASVEKINTALEKASQNELKNILGFETRPLVSMDFKGDPRSSIVDAENTLVVGDNMVKVIAWYDNEWGYSNRLAELAELAVERL